MSNDMEGVVEVMGDGEGRRKGTETQSGKDDSVGRGFTARELSTALRSSRCLVYLCRFSVRFLQHLSKNSTGRLKKEATFLAWFVATLGFVAK